MVLIGETANFFLPDWKLIEKALPFFSLALSLTLSVNIFWIRVCRRARGSARMLEEKGKTRSSQQVYYCRVTTFSPDSRRGALAAISSSRFTTDPACLGNVIGPTCPCNMPRFFFRICLFFYLFPFFFTSRYYSNPPAPAPV